MLAIVGAVCILIACGGFGLLVARSRARRPVELRRLRSALQQLETAVAYCAPLPEALRAAAAVVDGSARRLLAAAADNLVRGDGCTAAEAWEAAVASSDPVSAWSAADRQALLDLGASLGTSGRDDQLKHLHLCAGRLEGLEAEARAVAAREVRLWTYLGFLAGAGLVIALL